MIPIFNATINTADEGIWKISLVDLPAVESDFVAFNKQDKQMKFNIQNEEQRMVTGVIMRADFNIYRYDEDFGEYYIRYSKDTIKKMAEKMMADNTFNNINLQHEDGSDVDGVNLVELFIKDTTKGISPAGFDDIEDGSLFATYKINNDVIWEEIKAGTFRGFSLEGYFQIERTELKKQTKTQKQHNIMSTLFNKFLKSFVKCGSMTTDKGELFWVGEADLQIGDELFYNTDNEEAVKVEDGDYTLEDGTVVVVKDGLVSEIREKDGEQEGELDMEDEDKKEEECLAEETVEEKPGEEEIIIEDETDEMDEMWDNIDDLRAKYDELKGMFDEMKNTLDDLLNKPAAEPIVEEFEKYSGTKADNGIPAFGSKSKTFHK